MGIYRRLFSCCRGRVDRRMSYNNKDRAGVAAMLERFEANVERDGCVPLQISLRGRNMKRGVTMPHLVRKRSPSFKQRVMSPLANTTVIVARNHTNFSWGTNLPVYLPSKLQRTPGENRCLFNRMEVEAEGLQTAIGRLKQESVRLEMMQEQVEKCCDGVTKCMELREASALPVGSAFPAKGSLLPTFAQVGIDASFPDDTQRRLQHQLEELIEIKSEVTELRRQLTEASHFINNYIGFVSREIEDKALVLQDEPSEHLPMLPSGSATKWLPYRDAATDDPKYPWRHSANPNMPWRHANIDMKATTGMTIDDRWGAVMPSGDVVGLPPQRPHSALFRGGAGTMMWRKPPNAAESTHRHDSTLLILSEAQNQIRHAGRLMNNIQGFAKHAVHKAHCQQTQLQELLQCNIRSAIVQTRSLSHNRQFPERELKHHRQGLKELAGVAARTEQGPLTTRAHHNEVGMVDLRIKTAQAAIDNGEKLIDSLGTMMDADKLCVSIQQNMKIET